MIGVMLHSLASWSVGMERSTRRRRNGQQECDAPASRFSPYRYPPARPPSPSALHQSDLMDKRQLPDSAASGIVARNTGVMGFTGWPVEAVEFYEGLADD